MPERTVVEEPTARHWGCSVKVLQNFSELLNSKTWNSDYYNNILIMTLPISMAISIPEHFFSLITQILRVCSAISKKLQHAPGMYVGYMCNKWFVFWIKVERNEHVDSKPNSRQDNDNNGWWVYTLNFITTQQRPDGIDLIDWAKDK